MRKVLGILKFLGRELGPLVAFWAMNAAVGLKPAIIAAIVLAIAEVAWRRSRGEELSQLFIFSVTMTVLFGAIDLLLVQPVFLRYEASVTNLATAVFFGAAAFGRKPLIMEFAEQSGGLSGQRPPDLVPYFRIFTLVWAAYFLVKAGLYAWIGSNFDLTHAAALRFLIGGGSFYTLLAVSMLGGRALYRLMRWSGLLAVAVRMFPADAPPT